MLDHELGVQGEPVTRRVDPLAVRQGERLHRPDGPWRALANQIVGAVGRHAASPVRSSALAISWVNGTCSSAAAGIGCLSRWTFWIDLPSLRQEVHTLISQADVL